jgi:endonuclease-3
LNFQTPHQLMVATILLAQCTDERVNAVTPELFRKYLAVKDFAEADIKELEREVFSTGFYANKAKSIKKSAQQLIELHGGEMPRSMEQLIRLAGVGRKTASVILGAAFGLAEGIVVDTHVGRISRLLSLTSEKDPIAIERDLMKVVPSDDWIVWSHMLIEHGRSLCKARKPDCGNCFLKDICPSASV